MVGGAAALIFMRWLLVFILLSLDISSLSLPSLDFLLGAGRLG